MCLGTSGLYCLQDQRKHLAPGYDIIWFSNIPVIQPCNSHKNLFSFLDIILWWLQKKPMLNENILLIDNYERKVVSTILYLAYP